MTLREGCSELLPQPHGYVWEVHRFRSGVESPEKSSTRVTPSSFVLVNSFFVADPCCITVLLPNDVYDLTKNACFLYMLSSRGRVMTSTCSLAVLVSISGNLYMRTAILWDMYLAINIFLIRTAGG